VVEDIPGIGADKAHNVRQDNRTGGKA